MQAPHAAPASRSKPVTLANYFGPLAPPAVKENRKKRQTFEFKCEQPAKPLPIPKIDFNESVIPKLKNVCTSKLDETRYSNSRAQHLINMQPHYEKKIRVASWNLLMKDRDKKLNPNHPAFDASQLWPNRVPVIAAAINSMSPDIIGCQELYESQDYNQEDDLFNYIGTNYVRYSEKSPDGEHNTIFLKRDVFKVIHTHTYKCVDKAITLMIVIFRDQKVVIINTHFSIEANAREAQANIVSSLIKKFLTDKDLLILTIDGNLLPNDPYNVKTKAGWDGPYIESILKRDNLIIDSFEKSLFGHVGSLGTYTNDEHNAEPFRGLGSPGARLDRIFVSHKIDVFIHSIEPFITKEKKFPSDHQAVVVDLLILDSEKKPEEPKPVVILKKPAAAATQNQRK